MHFRMDVSTFDWNHLRAFLTTLEAGSYSAAARVLGVSQPTVGRQVAQLETTLGTTLFDKVSGRLELTDAGLGLVEHARAMRDAAHRVTMVADGQAQTLVGSVSITASQAVSAYYLPAAVRRLRDEYPGIRVVLEVSNEARDLHRREADIAVRNFQPEHPDLIARKVAVVDAGLFASPAYIEREGPLDTPAQVAGAEIFDFDGSMRVRDGLRALGLPVDEDTFRVQVADHLVQWSLCREGLGIAMMMAPVGNADPAVQRLLPDLRIPIPIWLVVHREVKTSRRLRVVYDVLRDVFANTPAHALPTHDQNKTS